MKTISTILMISVIVLFSCKKQDSTEIITPTPTLEDNILISKIVQLDTTKVAPLDTLQITNFTYDNLKRLSKIRITYYPLLTANSDTGFSSNVTLFYNGSDTVLYKTINQYQEYTYKATITSFFSFSATMLYDSTIRVSISPLSGTTTYIKKTIFNNNTATVYNKNYYTNGIQYDTILSTFTKQNSNYTSQNNIRVNTPSGNEISNFSCIYDNKNNPFNKLFSFYNSNIKLDIGDVTPFNYGKSNNVTEINNTSILQNAPVGTIPSRVNYKYFYTYNSNNYPTEVRIQKVSLIGIAFSNDNCNKIKYFYTN